MSWALPAQTQTQILATASVDPIARETHLLVQRTADLVSTTRVLAFVTAAAVIVPLVYQLLRAVVSHFRTSARAKATVQVDCKLLEVQLMTINKLDATQVSLIGDSEFLIGRLLDSSVTKYLARGVFEQLAYAATTAHAVIQVARTELLPALRNVETLTAKGLISVGERWELNRDKKQMTAIAERAFACVVMLGDVRKKIRGHLKSDFIDWNKEYSQTAR